MKMICDVPDEVIKSVRMCTWCGSSVLEKMIVNGTPIPDNATNLDVLKIMFPDYIPKDFTWVLGGDGADWDKPKGYCGNWWNAPYQKGGK